MSRGTHKTLVITEMRRDGPVDIGTITLSNGQPLFSGDAEQWYNSVIEDFEEAPSDIESFMKWADEKFDGNYFSVNLTDA